PRCTRSHPSGAAGGPRSTRRCCANQRIVTSAGHPQVGVCYPALLVGEVMAEATLLLVEWAIARVDRASAMFALLSHLESLPGGSWQERWDTSDFAAATRWDKRGTNRISTYRSSVGMKLMFCLRVIRPTLPALRARPIHHYADLFRVAEADPQLDRFHEQVG